VRVRRVALHLRGPASFPCGLRRSRGLPVLVHVVSQRARVLRLRRTVCSLAFNAIQPCCLPPIRRESASWFCVFRSSIARPTDTPVYASSHISRCHPQDSGPRWSRCLPSCRTLSFPTTCRFIPAHRDERSCVYLSNPTCPIGRAALIERCADWGAPCQHRTWRVSLPYPICARRGLRANPWAQPFRRTTWTPI